MGRACEGRRSCCLAEREEGREASGACHLWCPKRSAADTLAPPGRPPNPPTLWPVGRWAMFTPSVMHPLSAGTLARPGRPPTPLAPRGRRPASGSWWSGAPASASSRWQRWAVVWGGACLPPTGVFSVDTSALPLVAGSPRALLASCAPPHPLTHAARCLTLVALVLPSPAPNAHVAMPAV